MQINRVEMGKCFISSLAAHIRLESQRAGNGCTVTFMHKSIYISFQNQILFGQKFVQTELLKVQ